MTNTMTYENNPTSSCCAPDGTCSNSTENKSKEKKQAKPEFHFLTKLNNDQLKKIESTLKESQDQDDTSKNTAFIKNSLSEELPIYFLKKVIKNYEKKSSEPLLKKISELIN